MSQWLKKYGPDISFLAILAALVIYFTYPTWGTALSGGTDFLGHVYKARFLSDTWRDYGIVYPLWSSTWYAGYPFLQLYPPIAYYVMGFVSYLFHNDALSAKVLIVFAYLVSSWAMYFGVSRLFKNKVAGFLAAAAFVMYPFRTAHGIAGGNLPFMLSVSFAPLMVTTYMKAAREVSWQNAITVAMAASVVLLCHLNTFFLFTLLLGAYSIWAVLIKDVPHRRFVIGLEHIKLGAGVAMLTGLFSAFWLLPFATQARSSLISEYSEAIVRGSAIKSAASFIDPSQVADYIAPYAGIFAFVIIILAFLATDLRKDRRAQFFAISTMAVFILAVSKNTAIYAYLPFGKMIVPGRMLYISTVTLPAIFGLSAAALYTRVKTIKPVEAARALSSLLVILMFLGLVMDYSPARTIFGLSYRIPSSYRAFINHAKQLPADTRIFETEAAWNTYVYTPALTNTESLEGWYLEGAGIRDSLAMIKNSLVKDDNPRLLAPLLSLLNTRYVLVPRESKTRTKLLKTGDFKSSWRTSQYDLLTLTNETSPAIFRQPLLTIAKSPGNQYLLLARLNGGGSFVPVPGADTTLDKYFRADSFNDFPGVMLYGYDYMATRPDEGLLLDYIEDGGTVFICPDGSQDSDQKKATEIFDATVRVTEESGSVTWTANKEFAGINLKRFSPATWEGKPWSFSYFDGVTPLAKVNGMTVVGEKKIGKGRVVFIGFNLPYHVAYYKNTEEAKFLSMLIDSRLPKNPETASLGFNKEPYGKLDLTLKTDGGKARWVLVSEAYNAGWSATVNGKDAKIYKADPALMMVRLPSADQFELSMRYNRSIWNYLGLITSAMSILTALVLSRFPALRQWFKRKWPLLYRPEKI